MDDISCGFHDYQTRYQQSITDPEKFWSEQAHAFIDWITPWDKVQIGDFTNLDICWFSGGQLNACYNCVDRHLATRAHQLAIIWEGDDPSQTVQLTYAQLHEQVCRFANVLKQQGVRKGDRVCIYLPMIPEIAIAMLACARMGAIHSVVFAGFSADSLKTRILDADCQVVITADGSKRGGRLIPLKEVVDEALTACPQVRRVIVVKHTHENIVLKPERDSWYCQAMAASSVHAEPEVMNANDPLFILYTSGSTGKPKGVVHATGGYLVYSAITYKYIFDYRQGDIYWCTADAGWITGHSYGIYGPLLNGATTLIFEGVPYYPNFSRFWDIIDKYQVTIFYTAPTALRALRQEGDTWVKQTSRSSLRLLGTVGEPINPNVWAWYYQVVGENRCTIVDTWWQTETGGILISAFPKATPLKPGSAAWPFFGIIPAIVDDKGLEINDATPGKLIIKQPWPGLMQTIYGDPQRFIANYFQEFPGNYATSDGAYRDAEGYYWITGRNDDVIKVSGHRIGTGEIESALLTDPEVAEAAAVGIVDEIKGQAIYAFVTLKIGVIGNDALKKRLIQQVRKVIGPLAAPKHIQWAKALPKTRSGKIMRRVLKKIAAGEFKELGDLSTLADANVVKVLIEQRLS